MHLNPIRSFAETYSSEYSTTCQAVLMNYHEWVVFHAFDNVSRSFRQGSFCETAALIAKSIAICAIAPFGYIALYFAALGEVGINFIAEKFKTPRSMFFPKDPNAPVDVENHFLNLPEEIRCLIYAKLRFDDLITLALTSKQNNFSILDEAIPHYINNNKISINNLGFSANEVDEILFTVGSKITNFNLSCVGDKGLYQRMSLKDSEMIDLEIVQQWVEKCPNIQNLSVYYFDSENMTTHLCCNFARSQHLRSLHLGNIISYSNLKVFGKKFPHLTQLCYCTRGKSEFLYASALKFPNLINLNVHFYGWSLLPDSNLEIKLRNKFKAKPAFNKIEKIKLEYFNFDVLPFVENIHTNSLQRLSLTHIKGKACSDKLVAKIATFSQLSRLKLDGISKASGNLLSEKLVKLISLKMQSFSENIFTNFFSENLTNLTRLDLNCGFHQPKVIVDEQTFMDFAKSLANLINLREFFFGLVNYRINERTRGIALIKSLTRMRRLYKLTLRGSKIGNEGAVDIAKKLKNLTHINLFLDCITHETILEIVKKMKGLVHLSFSIKPDLRLKVVEINEIIYELLKRNTMHYISFPENFKASKKLSTALQRKFPEAILDISTFPEIF